MQGKQHAYRHTESYKYLRGFPIKRRILHHSTLLSFFIFSCGKDSFMQIEKSFSIRNRGLRSKQGDMYVNMKETTHHIHFFLFIFDIIIYKIASCTRKSLHFCDFAATHMSRLEQNHSQQTHLWALGNFSRFRSRTPMAWAIFLS